MNTFPYSNKVKSIIFNEIVLIKYFIEKYKYYNNTQIIRHR